MVTAQQPGQRIVPPEEARAWEVTHRRNARHDSANLAHTAAVLGEQREAVLALMKDPMALVSSLDGVDAIEVTDLARALGVTE